MRRMERRYKSRPRIESSVVNNQEVFRFNFHDTLQDLLNSSAKHLHEVLPDRERENAVIEGTEHELWNTPWMSNTFAMEQYLDFDPKKDIMLPIVLYMDKTGTDVNQRYSLEPVLFSVAAIPREHRESRHSWRHLGFVPQKQRCSDEESSSDLQFLSQLSILFIGWIKSSTKESTNSYRQVEWIGHCRKEGIVTTNGRDGRPTLPRHIVWSLEVQFWWGRQSTSKLHVFISEHRRPISHMQESQLCNIAVVDKICNHNRTGYFFDNWFQPNFFIHFKADTNHKELFIKTTQHVSNHPPSPLHCSRSKECI